MTYEETLIREHLEDGTWTPASVVKIKRVWARTAQLSALQLADYMAEKHRVEVRQILTGNTLRLSGMVKLAEDGPWQVSCFGECSWEDADTTHGVPLAAVEIASRRLIRCHLLAALVHAWHVLDENEGQPAQ